MSEAIDLLVKKKAVEDVRKATEEVMALDAQIIKLANDANQFAGKPLFKPLPSDVNKRLSENSKFITQINAKNKEAERLQNSLARAQAKLNAAESKRARTLSQTRVEQAKNNRKLREEAILNSTLTDAYDKLSVKRNRAARTLRNLEASQSASNRQLRQAQKEFNRLDAQVAKADRRIRDHRKNVGQYERAWQRGAATFRTAIAAFGLYSGIEIGRQIFEQVKAINGLNLALEQVTETQDRFNAAQVFISEVAEEAGTDIFALQSAYTKFLASAKTTNLTSEETNNIFRQVAKAGGVLGLSTEQVNGAFRALEQILSKGKVQAEEIRGQLGERLPGAFQILAKSMGLTTAELSKQLELGNVLSDEVLPGFAKELEKTYNLNLVKKVETLAAAQTRLGNAWKTFLANVEGGEGAISRVFGKIFEVLTKAVQFLDDYNKSIEETREEYDKGLSSQKMQEELADIRIKAIGAGISLKNQARLLKSDYIFAVEDAGKKVNELKNRIEELEKSQTNGRQQGQKRMAQIKELNIQLEREQSNLAVKKGKLDAVNKVLKPTVKNTEDFKDELKDTSDSLDDLTPKLEKVSTILFGTTKDEAEKTAKEINKIEKALSGITSKFRTGFDLDGQGNIFEIFSNEQTIGFGEDAFELPSAAEFETRLLNKVKEAQREILKESKLTAKQLEYIYGGVFDTFSQYYGVDTTLFQKLLEQKEVELSDYTTTAKSLIETLTQSFIIGIENERSANQEKLSAIEADERLSDEQKAIAREKFQKEEQKLRLKQAKAERSGVLFQIAIDTAQAIAKALTTAATLAANPFTAALASNAFAQAGIAAGVGAAQAAFVLAQPLPQFAKGTQNAPEGYARTDEKGAEIHTDKYGNIKDLGSNKGSRVKWLDKGDKIYTATETKQLLNNNFIENNARQQEIIDMWLMRKTMVDQTGMIRNEIKQGFKNAKIINNNKIVLEEKYSQY